MDKFLKKKADSKSDPSSSPKSNCNSNCICNSDSDSGKNVAVTESCGTKRNRKGFSKVWKYFKKSEDKKLAKCLKCGKECKTSGNTSNLHDHLKRFHPNLNDVEEEEGSINATESANLRASTSTSISSGNNSSSATSSMRSVDSYFKRSIHYDQNSKRKKELDMALMWMIASDFQPYNIVENIGFRRFVTALDPKYTIPSKHTIKNNYMYKEYVIAKALLQNMLDETKNVAITCDCWTSCSNESYLSTTCHFIDNNFELKIALLSVRKLNDITNHTAQNIANSLESVFCEWNIKNKITCIVTDNASSMIKACELLKIRNLPCFAHTINLAVQDSLSIECVQGILNKCKGIVKYFKSSSIAMEKFKLAQNSDKPYTLIQEVPTRWNSAYAMIKRILNTNEAVCKVLLNTQKAPSPLTADDILVLKDLDKLLCHFDEISNRICGSKYVTISLIIPIVYGVFTKIVNVKNNLSTSEGKNVSEAIIKSIQKRFFPYEGRSLARLGTILDPRFKKEGFRVDSNAEEASKLLEGEMLLIVRSEKNQNKTTTQHKENETPQTQVNAEKNESIFHFLDKKISQKNKTSVVDVIITKRQYLERANAAQDIDPLLYWKVNGDALTPLPECASKFLCVPASSVESERVFSTTGQIISERRSRLKDKNVNILVFMNRNRWLFEK